MDFLYGLEIWGHTITTDRDPLITLQNKILRIIFDCKRSEDAWRHSNGRILTVNELYNRSLTNICLRHHYNRLPESFSSYVMPNKYIDRTSNTHNYNLRSSKETSYNYERSPTYSLFQENCRRIWNASDINTKSKPYHNKHIQKQDVNDTIYKEQYTNTAPSVFHL